MHPRTEFGVSTAKASYQFARARVQPAPHRNLGKDSVSWYSMRVTCESGVGGAPRNDL